MISRKNYSALINSESQQSKELSSVRYFVIRRNAISLISSPESLLFAMIYIQLKRELSLSQAA